MNEADHEPARVRFYGVHDLATGYHLPRVVHILESFDPDEAPTSTLEVIELHNVQQYLEHGILPRAYTEQQVRHAKRLIPHLRSTVARFFSRVDDTNIAMLVADVDYQYHADLLDLLGRYQAFTRCSAATMLGALQSIGVSLGGLLASKKLVDAYDPEVRNMLRASSHGAEHLIRKYLERDVQQPIHLPRSFKASDAHEVLTRYVDSEGANPNYLGLIATARDNSEAGIDARLRLRAKRRGSDVTAKLFETATLWRTGCEVSILGDQEEPVVAQLDESDGLISRYTYSDRWLEQTCDNPSILNNFMHLFDFVDRNVLLVLPSYPAHLGVIEGLMGATGRTEYKIGAAFRATDMSTLLQTRMYHQYLDSKKIDLENVISWFFQEYLTLEFTVEGFIFTPSESNTSFLQRVRHLFAEMESVASQFSMYVRDREIDRDLLAMESDQIRYKVLPSLLDGKYLYQGDDEEIRSVLHLLFSNQSSLGYIREDLSADNVALLVEGNDVAYGDFHEYQKPAIDRLMALGLLENSGTRLQIRSSEQLRILWSIFTTQASSYYHLSNGGRQEADAMVARGWLVRRSSLLTEAEGQYFNYLLNSAEFSNGPALRNKYVHGSQPNTDGEDAHFHTYITALRTLIALVIKMNDDLCLADAEHLLKPSD